MIFVQFTDNSGYKITIELSSIFLSKKDTFHHVISLYDDHQGWAISEEEYNKIKKIMLPC